MTLDRFMNGLMVVAFVAAVLSATLGAVYGLAPWAWGLNLFTFVGLALYLTLSPRMRRY